MVKDTISIENMKVELRTCFKCINEKLNIITQPVIIFIMKLWRC